MTCVLSFSFFQVFVQLIHNNAFSIVYSLSLSLLFLFFICCIKCVCLCVLCSVLSPAFFLRSTCFVQILIMLNMIFFIIRKNTCNEHSYDYVFYDFVFGLCTIHWKFEEKKTEQFSFSFYVFLLTMCIIFRFLSKRCLCILLLCTLIFVQKVTIHTIIPLH